MTSKAWIAVGAGWAVTVVAAFYSGSLLQAPESGTSERETQLRTKTVRVMGVSDAGGGLANERRGRSGETGRSSLEAAFGSQTPGGGAWQVLADEAIRSPNPIVRRLAFARLLEQLNPENAREVRETLVSLGANGDQWRDFNYAWGALAGADAFKFAQESEEEDLQAVLTGWAAAKPSEAIAMLDALPAGSEEERNRMEQSIVAGLADHDLQMATDLAVKLGTGRGRDGERLMRTVAGEVLRTGGAEEAARWVEGIADGDMKGAALDRVAADYVRRDAESAAAWVEQFADEDYAIRAVAEVGEEWAERNPQAAVAWLEGLPEGSPQEAGFRSALGDWEDRDPEAAANYLMSMPVSRQRDAAISGFAGGYAWQDPQTAIAWAFDISDPALRSESLTRVGQAYLRRKPAEARAWLDSGDLPEGVREAVLNSRR